MTVNLLAINIGNTHTWSGTYVDDELVASNRFENRSSQDVGAGIKDAFGPLQDRSDAVVLLASVAPPAAERLQQVVAETLGVKLLRVERDVPIPIGRQLDPEAIVGEDRLLNVAAAYHTLKQSCVVVDAGTTITIDFVDGAGTFHGGAIGPGVQMMLESMHRYTAQLPEVEFTAPEEPIGHNTTQAMCSGVFHGLRGMVRELVEHYAEQVGSYPIVVATGGNAEVLFGKYELVERIVPELTLMGMAISLRCAIEARDG